MKILFLGDVLGRTGRDAVAARLPGLRKDQIGRASCRERVCMLV